MLSFGGQGWPWPGGCLGQGSLQTLCQDGRPALKILRGGSERATLVLGWVCPGVVCRIIDASSLAALNVHASCRLRWEWSIVQSCRPEWQRTAPAARNGCSLFARLEAGTAKGIEALASPGGKVAFGRLRSSLLECRLVAPLVRLLEAPGPQPASSARSRPQESRPSLAGLAPLWRLPSVLSACADDGPTPHVRRRGVSRF